MDLGHPDRRGRLDALAAEYALGTLSGRARQRLARAARRDAGIAQAIEHWQLRLASLGAAVPPVTPPPRVWDGIVRRLGLAGAPAAATPGWRFWRGLAVAATVAALALGIALIAGRMEPAGPGVVVILAGPDARPALSGSCRSGP